MSDFESTKWAKANIDELRCGIIRNICCGRVVPKKGAIGVVDCIRAETLPLPPYSRDLTSNAGWPRPVV